MSDETSSMECPRDEGFTLIELLVVIVVLGVLAAIAVFAVGGLTASAEQRGCEADRVALDKAVTVYKEMTDRDTIRALGDRDDEDRFEKRLIDDGYLNQPSTFHKVNLRGKVVAEPGSPCP